MMLARIGAATAILDRRLVGHARPFVRKSRIRTSNTLFGQASNGGGVGGEVLHRKLSARRQHSEGDVKVGLALREKAALFCARARPT
jgi:hypothetical protein